MFSRISFIVAGLLLLISLFAQADIITYEGDLAETLFRSLSTVGSEITDSCADLQPSEALQVCVVEEARAQGDTSCSRFEDIRATYTESQLEAGHWYLARKQIKVTYLCKLLLH